MITRFDRQFLGRLDRSQLRRALWFMRWQDRHMNQINPAAAQYFGLATTRSVMAEYRRRGWRLPKITISECC